MGNDFYDCTKVLILITTSILHIIVLSLINYHPGPGVGVHQVHQPQPRPSGHRNHLRVWQPGLRRREADPEGEREVSRDLPTL